MTSRLLATLLLAGSSVAHANEPETALQPSCAAIDLERDTLTAEQREMVKQQLTRALEREELLVVENGCIDRYLVSHVEDGDHVTIRLAGPGGVRKLKRGSFAKLPSIYGRMIRSLLTPPTPAESTPAAPSRDDAPRSEPTVAAAELPAGAPPEEPAAPRSDTEESIDDEVAPADEVAADRILYAQLGLASYGMAFAVGYRRQVGEHVALDLHASAGGGGGESLTTLGAQALYVAQPRRRSTTYIGAGLGYADQEQYGMLGSGVRAEAMAGYAFARDGAARWFAQIDVGMPFYAMRDVYVATETVAPTIALSIGVGY